MGEGEGLKLCADGEGWSCENEGNVESFGERKDYVHFNVEWVVYISFVIITLKFLYFHNFLCVFPLLLLFLKTNFFVCVECASSCVPWVRGVFKNAR